jgi:hypothetical protein
VYYNITSHHLKRGFARIRKILTAYSLESKLILTNENTTNITRLILINQLQLLSFTNPGRENSNCCMLTTAILSLRTGSGKKMKINRRQHIIEDDHKQNMNFDRKLFAMDKDLYFKMTFNNEKL